MNWTFKSVAVVGSGAIGLYYGGRLAAAGEDVRFLTRSDYAALARGGLKVESVHGDFEVPRVQAFRTPEEIGPVDLVIVAWKATANDLLGAVLPPLLHAETQVLTLQNGLGNCEAIADITGPARVLGGLVFCLHQPDLPGSGQPLRRRPGGHRRMAAGPARAGRGNRPALQGRGHSRVPRWTTWNRHNGKNSSGTFPSTGFPWRKAA